MKTFLTIVLLSLLISGCGLFETRTRTIHKTEKPVILHPKKPDQMDIKDVDWEVWNKKNLVDKLIPMIEDVGVRSDLLSCINKEADEELTEDMVSQCLIDLFIAELNYIVDESNQEPAWFVLRPKGYENLGLNMQEIIRFIKEQNLIIQHYHDVIPENYTEPEEQSE